MSDAPKSDAAPRRAAATAQGPFSAWTAFWLIAIGVFAFSAYVTLGAFAPDFSRGDDGGGHALSRSAVGFAGAVKLEHLRGRTVIVSRSARVGRTAFAILTPERAIAKGELTALGAQTRLIILPKWAVTADPIHRGWVVSEGPTPARAAAAPLAEIAPKASLVQGAGRAPVTLARVDIPGRLATPLVTGPIANLQTISGPGLLPVFTDAGGHMILAALDDRTTYVLADPDFLNTQGLGDPATARAGMAMLDELSPPARPIAFDVTLNGFARTRSITKLALEPPFLGATLAALAAALLLGWRAGVRFGAPAPAGRAIAFGKQALADNSAGLIRLARREGAMGWPYLKVMRASVARAIAVRADADEPALISLLDRVGRAQNVSSSYSELAAEAAAASTPGAVLTVARKLFQWRHEMTRAAS